MYTNPLYLRIKNTKERCAAIAIITALGKLSEKKKLIKGASLSVYAPASQLSTSGTKFIMKTLPPSFENIAVKYNYTAGIITATVTPR